jgi:hypothetical protein
MRMPLKFSLTDCQALRLLPSGVGRTVFATRGLILAQEHIMNQIHIATKLAHASRALRVLEAAWAALTAGARAIPLGDNGMLLRGLAAHIEDLNRRH